MSLVNTVIRSTSYQEYIRDIYLLCTLAHTQILYHKGTLGATGVGHTEEYLGSVKLKCLTRLRVDSVCTTRYSYFSHRILLIKKVNIYSNGTCL